MDEETQKSINIISVVSRLTVVFYLSLLDNNIQENQILNSGPVQILQWKICLKTVSQIFIHHHDHQYHEWEKERKDADLQDVLIKRRSKNMQQVYRRTPMPKCDSAKLFCNFIGIALWSGSSPVNLLHNAFL